MLLYEMLDKTLYYQEVWIYENNAYDQNMPIFKGEVHKARGDAERVWDYLMCEIEQEELGAIGRIIRSHMDDIRNSEWTSVEESLPKAKDKVLVTVKHSSWIADFDSKWVSEKEKTYHPETRSAYIGYINDDDIWIFIDEEGQENICDKAFGRNLGSVYDVVTHWKPLPEPYKPKETTTAGREHIMSRFTKVE